MRIFSGIQPTGRKHLGNYIGAITQYVAGQDRGDPAIYCIVDLHAITVAYDPVELRERTYDLGALLLAAGLDPERCILFRQGDVHEHTELGGCSRAVIPLGELNRMHQFREKSAAQRELVSAGLFIYPVLQAADVLAYRAHEVPVGEDQREHVELMRRAPSASTAASARRSSCRRPASPRSARASGTCRTRPEDVDHAAGRAGHGLRARRARRDREEVQARGDRLRARDRPGRDKPGISNLIEILAVIRGASAEDVEREFADSRYGDFKVAVAEAVVEYLAPVRERYGALRADEDALGAMLEAGAEKARAIAAGTVGRRAGAHGRRQRRDRRPGALASLRHDATAVHGWSSTSTSSPGPSTCCSRSSCARSSTCSRSSWPTSCSPTSTTSRRATSSTSRPRRSSWC